jgi:hypothetical protein
LFKKDPEGDTSGASVFKKNEILAEYHKGLPHKPIEYAGLGVDDLQRPASGEHTHQENPCAG